jgi:hypothetical protein
MITIDIYRPDQWHDFFVLVGTGAAGLTGLLVVAMSLHLEVVAHDAALRHRALSILVGLAAAFMRCAFVLMGGQNHKTVGVELLIVCVLVIATGINSYIKTLKYSSHIPRSIKYRTIGSISCYLAEIIGAMILISGSISGLYIAAIAMVTHFYFMFSGSWLLLVGISSDETKAKKFKR